MNFVVSLLLVSAVLCSPTFAQDVAGSRFQAYQKDGIKLLQVKDYVGALNKFQVALREHTSWQTLQNIAICHCKLGDYNKAVADLQKSIEVGGIHSNQCMTMAGALEGLGKPKQALAWLELACSVDPAKRTDPVMQSAIQRLRDPRINPDGSANSADYVSALTATHKWRKEDLPLKIFIRKNIDVPQFYNEFASIARDSITQWCNASNGAISYQLVTDQSKANIICDYTDRPGLVSSDHESGICGSAEGGYSAKDNSQGKQILVVLVRKGPHGSFLDRSEILTTCLHEMGHALGLQHSRNPKDVMFLASSPLPVPQLSERDINTIRKIYPDLQMQGFTYVNQNNFPKALECFLAALKERPNSWMIMQSVGNCEQQLGHYDKAIEYYENSIRVGGVHGLQCRNMAAAYESNGQPEKASYWLKKGCSIDAVIANDQQVQATIKRLDAIVKNNSRPSSN